MIETADLSWAPVFSFEWKARVPFVPHRPFSVQVRGDSSSARIVEVTYPQQRGHDVPGRKTPAYVVCVALANLLSRDSNGRITMEPQSRLTLDEKALEKFVKQYGLLHGQKDASDFEPEQEKIARFAACQQSLRRAWKAGPKATFYDINPLEEELSEHLHINAVYIWAGEGLVIAPDNLWTYIALVFSILAAADRTGYCANPNCVAPYFIKKRRTQIFCEKGPCTAHAARLYTKHWWDKKGKKQRAKKRAKRQIKKRSKR